MQQRFPLLYRENSYTNPNLLLGDKGSGGGGGFDCGRSGGGGGRTRIQDSRSENIRTFH